MIDQRFAMTKPVELAVATVAKPSEPAAATAGGQVEGQAAGDPPLTPLVNPRLTPLEARWLDKYRALRPLPIPHAHWNLAHVYEHPRLLAEILRISGMASIGCSERDPERIREICHSGVPVALQWSPNDSVEFYSWSAFRDQCARVAAHSTPAWAILDDEWSHRNLPAEEAFAYRMRFVDTIREVFGDGTRPSFYAHRAVHPSAGATGWSMSQTTAGSEPSPVNVSLYRPYDFGWTAETLRRSVEGAALSGLLALPVPSVELSLLKFVDLMRMYQLREAQRAEALQHLPDAVVWFPLGWAQVPRGADMWVNEFAAPEMTDTIYWQWGARLNHAWFRNPIRRERFGPLSTVRLVVFYPFFDPRAGAEASARAFWHYCQGAALDQTAFSAEAP